MAAMLLPLAMGAVTLEPNQRIIGHYTTDDLNETGWGKVFLRGVNPIATDITPDELAVFQGSKIVAFRVGLAQSAPITRVFVMPVKPNGTPTGEVTEWACNASDQGWNLIELETPYEINLPSDYSLRIGFDYEQVERNDAPISAVPVGTIYPTLIFRNSAWMNYGINTTGNLSLQCIAENDNFPQFIIRMQDLVNKGNVKVGDDFNYSFKVRNLGDAEIAAGNAQFDVAIDGNVVATITNPAALTNDWITLSGTLNTAGLEACQHTLTVSLSALNGEAVENPVVLTNTFNVFEFGFSRQMRLVEQFTSTGCTYCPAGTANVQGLCDMRGDIAWVSVHENMGNTDPFRTAQTDSITDLQGVDGFPEGTFDRSIGAQSANQVYAVLTNMSPSQMNDFLEQVSDNPSWATVNVNSTFDATTREAVITIDGELVPNYEDYMGTDSKLTVYITEDGLVASQVSGGSNYVHNNVLRKALVSVKGVDLKKTGDAYKNEFTITIPSAWNADNLNVVAFVSRPLGNALDDIYVTNANKRKLGEYDEPTAVRGDVDGDGKVNIDDVTMIIDCLLQGTEPTGEGADCYVDGKLNIDDVTALIDFLLNGVWAE